VDYGSDWRVTNARTNGAADAAAAAELSVVISSGRVSFVLLAWSRLSAVLQ